jgi:hypothetical protein
MTGPRLSATASMQAKPRQAAARLSMRRIGFPPIERTAIVRVRFSTRRRTHP